MGTRNDEKGQRFEFLVKRIDEAIDAGYYIEASSLSYALLEERTYSLLDKIGVTYRHSDKLFDCLELLKKAINNRNITVSSNEFTCNEIIDWLKSQFLDSDLVNRINDWRKKRNDVTHDLAKETIDYSELVKFAKEGKNIFRNYTSLIMKLKKMLK